MRLINALLHVVRLKQVVLGYAFAVALGAVRERLPVLFELVAVVVAVLANRVLLVKLLLVDLSGALLLRPLLSFELRFFLLSLLLEAHLLHRVLIQILVQVLLPLERLVGVADELSVLLDLTNFLEVLFQVLAGAGRADPLLRLFSDLLDD